MDKAQGTTALNHQTISPPTLTEDIGIDWQAKSHAQSAINQRDDYSAAKKYFTEGEVIREANCLQEVLKTKHQGRHMLKAQSYEWRGDRESCATKGKEGDDGQSTGLPANTVAPALSHIISPNR